MSTGTEQTQAPKKKKGRPLGFKVSEETKAKMAATRAANKALKGKHKEIFKVSKTEI